MKIFFPMLLALLSTVGYSQSALLTPFVETGMHTVEVIVPAKFTGNFPINKTLQVPTGYTVSVFQAGGLNKPRFMAFSPTGVLHVSDMNAGKVYALPDTNKDGIADKMVEAASGFSGNHDVKFYKGAMYVTEPTRIWKCTDTNGDGVYETKAIFISNIANNSSGGHTTRTVVFDSIHKKVYVSIGSSCNVCREDDRAIIEQYNEDGTGRRVFASGTRNAVGMAMHPVTHQLWANNNGSDNQGNEIPPEWIDVVRDGGFYGHPFAYGDGVWFNFNAASEYQALKPITIADSAKVATLIQPAALIRAHSAPMALEFLNSKFGTTLQYGFITALRGSWNTTKPNDFRGFKVLFGHLSSGQDTTVDYVSDFCTGFLTDTVNRVFWGRPVGLAIDTEGKVYISSDEVNKFILVLTPIGIAGIRKNDAVISASAVYPNPTSDAFTLSMTLTQPATVKAVLYDISGKAVRSIVEQHVASGSHIYQIDVNGLTGGYYLLHITAGNSTFNHKLFLKQ